MDTILVEASEDSLDEINDFLNERLEAAGAAPDVCFQIELSVEEIVVNIASYAYTDGEESRLFGKLEVGCRMQEDPPEILIRFRDTGKPFDPLAKEDADLSGKMFMEQEGGFGIHMVKETMDEVSYAYEDGANVLTIRKKL
jgi:sigma-B regulation protein RsbU (phosphoserine phosphatase)